MPTQIYLILLYQLRPFMLCLSSCLIQNKIWWIQHFNHIQWFQSYPVYKSRQLRLKLHEKIRCPKKNLSQPDPPSPYPVSQVLPVSPPCCDSSVSLFTATCDPLWNCSKVQFTVSCDLWLNTWSKLYSILSLQLTVSASLFFLIITWGITIHKSQGLTPEKVVVEWGHADFSTGLSFVGKRFSRPSFSDNICSFSA